MTALLGLVAIILLVVLLALLLWPNRSRSPSRFTQLLDNLQPDFSHFDRRPLRVGRATTQTLALLTAAMVAFGIVVALWGASAGVMRTAWLYTQLNSPARAFPAEGAIGDSWLFLAFQILRGVGGVMVVCCASGIVGSLVGFVFGIPRPISAAETPPAAAGSGAPRNAPTAEAREGWKLSTNLTQISDWLTKIIVGVSLVEAKNAAGEFQAVSDRAAGWLFEMRHGSPILIPCAMLGGAAFGFLFGYLYTQLIISRLLAATESSLGPEIRPDVRNTIRQIGGTQESLVPRISRSAVQPELLDQPSPEEIAAAFQLFDIRFDDLLSNPALTPDEVRSWARAKALLNDYAAAAQGYMYLIGMR
jgi:hypothetical protein